MSVEFTMNEPVDTAQTLPVEDAERLSASGCPEVINQLKRISDHRAEAIHDSNSLRAVLGTLLADLLETETFVAHGMRQELTAVGFNLANGDSHRAAIELQLRLAKQSVQIAQLEMRSSGIDPATRKAKGR